MNVYPGNVSKPEPHFGWMSIILHLGYIQFTLFLPNKKHLDIASMDSSLTEDTLTIY